MLLALAIQLKRGDRVQVSRENLYVSFKTLSRVQASEQYQEDLRTPCRERDIRIALSRPSICSLQLRMELALHC